MTKRPDVTEIARGLVEGCLCHSTRMAARAITRSYDQALRPTGLRATQLSVLAAVAAEGALSIKALAETLEMDRTTLTRNLQPLEELGYVALGPEARHRSRTLSLTAAGRAALLAALPLWEEAQRRIKRRLGGENWPAVQQALRVLTDRAQTASPR